MVTPMEYSRYPVKSRMSRSLSRAERSCLRHVIERSSDVIGSLRRVIRIGDPIGRRVLARAVHSTRFQMFIPLSNASFEIIRVKFIPFPRNIGKRLVFSDFDE